MLTSKMSQWSSLSRDRDAPVDKLVRMTPLGFGLPRARTLHPDKIVALSKVTAKPKPKRRYTKPVSKGEGSQLVTNLAYKLHATRGR